MRSLAAVAAFAALLVTLEVARTPALADGADVKVAAPLLRTGATVTGSGLVAVSAKGDKVGVTFSVAGLPAVVAPPLGVFVETSVGGGTFAPAASIAALKGGKGKVALASASGPPASLGAAAVADLVGRAIEVRDAGGTALLSGRFPALSKFVGTKVSTTLAATNGSPLPNVNAKLSGTPSAKTGSEKFLLKVKGLAPGTVYTLFLEDALGSGVLVAVGDLVGGQFLRDQAKGDSLPLGAATLADLGGRAVEVRDPSGPVAHGTFPFFAFAQVWPRGYLFVIDEPGTTLDRYLADKGAIVVYRSQVDLTSVSTHALIDEGDGYWRVEPRGIQGDGLVVTVRRDDNPRFWWSVGNTADISGMQQHYLGLFNSSSAPSNLDFVKFVLHFGDTKVNGHRTARVESFLHPGEFLVNAGNGLAANGIRFSSTEAPIDFILR